MRKEPESFVNRHAEEYYRMYGLNPHPVVAYGYLLESGDVLREDDLYESSSGRWERCPCPGMRLLREDPEASPRWVRTSSVIERSPGCCSIDTLDGVEIRDGETLLVRWPDGQMQTVLACVSSRCDHDRDYSDTHSCRWSHAHVIAYHRGVQVMVPLLGLEAQRPISDSGIMCLHRARD